MSQQFLIPLDFVSIGTFKTNCDVLSIFDSSMNFDHIQIEEKKFSLYLRKQDLRFAIRSGTFIKLALKPEPAKSIGNIVNNFQGKFK